MEFKNVDEILNFATQREKEAVEFYTLLAREATQKSLREIFESFAKQEDKHVEMLSNISDNKEKIDAYEFREITDLKISDYMVETEYKEGMPMPEILKLAMKKEESAVKLYSDLAEKSDNDDAKKLFMLLVQEEAKHKFALESMYDDYLADQEN